MNCTRCGAVLPNGANVCPNCGTPVQMGQPMMNQQPMGQPMMNQQMGYQQPMGQPMMNQQMGYQQPMGQPMMNQQMGYQQPMGQPMMNQQMGYQPMGQSMNGGGIGAYFSSFRTDIMRAVGFVGAILMLISPFLIWYRYKEKSWGETIDVKNNLFQSGGVSILFALIIMVVAVGVVLLDMSNFVPALGGLNRAVANIKMIEVILLGAALLMVILATFIGELEGVKLSDLNDLNIKIKRGLGCIFAYIGVVLAACPVVIKMVGKR